MKAALCDRHLSAFSPFVVLLLVVAPVLAQQTDTIKVDTELVNLNVSVMNREGRPVAGLKKEDFEVYEDGKRQEITHFSADQRPLRLVLLFDTSVSMVAVLPRVRQEATALLSNLHPKDKVCVVSFASQVRLLSDWLQPEQAKSIVADVSPEAYPQPVITHTGYHVGDGNTNLYEALHYVLASNKGNDGQRVAVIVFSDGIDTAAGRSAVGIRQRANGPGADVRWYAKESWALLYPIRYRTEQVIGNMPEPARRAPTISIGWPFSDPRPELFSQIASASGGKVLEWTTQQDLVLAIQEVLSDLRSQYGIGYKPPRQEETKAFRRIKVRLKQPHLVSRTREGYVLIR